MGYCERVLAEVGREMTIDVRGRAERAQVVKLPFYRRPKQGVSVTKALT